MEQVTLTPAQRSGAPMFPRLTSGVVSGAESCVDCGINLWQDANASTACLACPANSFNSNYGAGLPPSVFAASLVSFAAAVRPLTVLLRRFHHCVLLQRRVYGSGWRPLHALCARYLPRFASCGGLGVRGAWLGLSCLGFWERGSGSGCFSGLSVWGLGLTVAATG
eukprot:2901632-Rhodomonas_salina.1